MVMLSIIMPAYNEADTIESVVKEVIESVNGIKKWEILIVDDGSKDSTYKKAKLLEELNGGKVRALSYNSNKGKGFALKYGFEHSIGDNVVFLDADMDLPPKQITRFFEIMEDTKADVVVGSKRHPESKVNYPLKRKLLSEVYFIIVKTLFNLNVKDTQVGLKLFKREVLEDIMPKLLVKRYAFDVELLANAIKKGYKIVEAPVELTFNFNSKINWKAIWYMSVSYTHLTLPTKA